MNERPEQPPEGRLLAAATEHSGLSIREASRRAGISYGRWRQITSGVQHVSPGEFAAVHAPARTLAKMAAVVGVTAEQMETEGQRPDAAQAMRDADRREVTAPAPSRSAFPLPPPTPDMARLLAPFLTEAETRVKVAQDAYPGQRLSGRQVYPDLPEGAAYWDALVEAGFPPEQLAPITATMLAMSAERTEIARRQDGHAAGLSRHLALRALR